MHHHVKRKSFFLLIPQAKLSVSYSLHHNSFTKIACNYFNLACKTLKPLLDIPLEAFLYTTSSHVPLCKGITTWGMEGIRYSLKFKLQQLL